MQREYLILMQGEKSCGAVKIEAVAEGLFAEISVDMGQKLPEGFVFRAYLVMPEKKEKRYLGVLEDHSGSFVLKDTAAPLGIVLTIRNIESGNEDFFCLCAEEGKLTDVKNCFENVSDVPVGTAEVTKCEESGKEYLKTAEQKLVEQFSDFNFEKVNGYFTRRNSPITEYIMRDGAVGVCIAECGYYYFGEKNEEDEFAIAVPSKKENPFENCAKYSFELQADCGAGLSLFGIVAGKDAEGEYFRRIKM